MPATVKAYVCVTNDLVTDQRVDKICRFLADKGADVTLVGRRLKQSLSVDRPYKTQRMRLIFTSGPLFYGFFNLRLFFFLLVRKTHIIVANDLDTLAACAWVKRLKPKTKLVYDSHEIFTEVPELSHSPRKKKIWKNLERKNIRLADTVYTVNHSIAMWFEEQYQVLPYVVRNMPIRRTTEKTGFPSELDPQKKYIIIQGAGINVDRGNEEMLAALHFIPDTIHLLVIGSGDVIPSLREICRKESLGQRVHFYPKMPYAQLMRYTANAWLGVTLDKNTNINYKFSLPNKLFDFIQAGCPVLCSDLPEVAAIVRRYETGIIAASHDPADIATCVCALLEDPARYALLKRNCHTAAQELCWETELPVLEQIYRPYLAAQR